MRDSRRFWNKEIRSSTVTSRPTTLSSVVLLAAPSPLRRPTRVAATLSCAGAFAGLLAGGCRCEKEVPYTPFGMTSALPEVPRPSSGPSASTSASAAAPTFTSQLAQRAPDEAGEWKLNDVALVAPKDQVIGLGLTAPLDGDATPDGVAWVHPKKAAGGELWFYPSGGAPKQLVPTPDFLPTTNCQLKPSLLLTGPHSISLDVTAECQGTFVDRSPQRALLVVSPGRAQPALVTLRVALPAPGEELGLTVDSKDRDEDGLEDARVVITLKAPEGSASAALSWLDRTAGAARDPSEPGASLTATVANELWRTKSKKTATKALGTLEAAGRLYASLCAEGGTPRIFDSEGSAFNCGKLDRFVDDYALGQVQAHLALGDVLGAFGTLSRQAWLHHPPSKNRLEQLQKTLEKAVVPVTVTAVRQLDPKVPARTGMRFSPLAFEQPESTLLIRSDSGLLRATADSTRAEPVADSEGIAPWPLEVLLPDGSRWDNVAQACGRSELTLSFIESSGTRRQDPIPSLLSARPGPCSPRPVLFDTPAAPLAVVGGKLAALIAGTRLGPTDLPHTLGSPRSPDGILTIHPTALGLLIVGGPKPELWRATSLPNPLLLTDCTVSNGARQAACVQGDRVIVLAK